MADVLVCRQKIHGLSPADYADAIRERRPDLDVAVANTPSEQRDLLQRTRVATGFDLDPAAIADADALELFVCTYAGTGHLPLEAFAEAGVTVESASGVHGPNVAEQVLGYLLTFVRDLHRGWQHEQRGTWNHYQAGELRGSTATVVGLGPIGRAVLERLDAFGVDTVGVRHTPSKGGPADEILGYDAIHDALARSDHVVLACPLTDVTRGLIDADAFLTMPADAVLVNVARGPVVDTDALVAALQTNEIGGAALDVTDPEPLPADHPLWALDQCRITPHNAGHTPHYWDRCAAILDDALAAIEE